MKIKADARLSGDRPQLDMLTDHFATKPSITGVEAATLYGIRSLTKRICELKSLGYRINAVTKRAPTGQRYVRYYYAGFNGLPNAARA